MKIVYDNQIFSRQIYGGVSKYFYEVLKRLPFNEFETTTIISNNEYIKKQDLFKYYNFLPGHYFKGKAILMDYINRPYTMLKLVFSDYDIFHQTDFSTYYFPYISGRKIVTTFHDMNYTKYKELYNPKHAKEISIREIAQKKSLERSDKIIAISQNTKNDLVNIWNINQDKITVIHHGVEKNKIKDLDSNRIIENPYLLYVGERYGFKNYSRFIKAFSIVSKKYPDIRLICTGNGFTNEEKNEMNALNVLENVYQISANENTMARLYRDAEMFVYPSFSEGFGMPILEAMVYNCPVVVGNRSCIPEIAGNAGVYFDPFNIDDIADKIIMLLSSEELRNEVNGKAIKQLEKFSWEKSAAMHMEVYNSLI